MSSSYLRGFQCPHPRRSSVLEVNPAGTPRSAGRARPARGRRMPSGGWLASLASRGAPDRRGQAGGAPVALERDLRAVVAVYLAAGRFERGAGFRVAVHHQDVAWRDGQDVASHRLVLIAVNGYHPD